MTQPPTGYCTRANIVRVIDGDTIEVEIVKRVPVRLLDCWAPETRTTDKEEKLRGLASKARLTEIAKGKHATLYVPTSAAGNINDMETMGRVLGQVWVDGQEKSLSEMQVEAGHATVKK